MAVLGFCCCWVSIHKGSFASAIYTMIYFGLVTTVIIVFNGTSEHSIDSDSDALFSSLGAGPKVILAINITVAVFAVLGILTCFLLLYGLLKRKPALLLPWVAVVFLTTLFDLTYVFYLIALASFNPITALLFLGDFVLIFLNGYAWLCVVSQYQNYVSDKNDEVHPSNLITENSEKEAVNLTNLNDLVPMDNIEALPRPSSIGRRKNGRRTVSFVTTVLCECDIIAQKTVSRKEASVQADMNVISSGPRLTGLSVELEGPVGNSYNNFIPSFQHWAPSCANHSELNRNSDASPTSNADALQNSPFFTKGHTDVLRKHANLTCTLSATPSTSATSVTSPASENNTFRSEATSLTSLYLPRSASTNGRVLNVCQRSGVSP